MHMKRMTMNSEVSPYVDVYRGGRGPVRCTHRPLHVHTRVDVRGPHYAAVCATVRDNVRPTARAHRTAGLVTLFVV